VVSPKQRLRNQPGYLGHVRPQDHWSVQAAGVCGQTIDRLPREVQDAGRQVRCKILQRGIASTFPDRLGVPEPMDIQYRVAKTAAFCVR
jgi:hypothetical protein